MSIICNENVSCEFMWSHTIPSGVTYDRYKFLPADGYALWRDNEEGNIDPETGEPWCYWWEIESINAEEDAPHIWAKLIDDTMETFGDGGEKEAREVATPKLRMMAASARTTAQAEKKPVL